MGLSRAFNWQSSNFLRTPNGLEVALHVNEHIILWRSSSFAKWNEKLCGTHTKKEWLSLVHAWPQTTPCPLIHQDEQFPEELARISVWRGVAEKPARRSAVRPPECLWPSLPTVSLMLVFQQCNGITEAIQNASHLQQADIFSSLYSFSPVQ